MPAKSTSCCCSECGVRTGSPQCCLCSCRDLCVTVTGPANGCNQPSVCDCQGAQAVFVWNKTLCAWAGTIACGDASIDLKFVLKDCDDGCFLCLSSTCLNLDGICPTGSDSDADCKVLTAGIAGCGKYIRNCDQSAGTNDLSLTWSVNASDCGDADCTSLTIDVRCAPYVNPVGVDAARICKDCDCICKCLCITLNEPSCDDCTKKACWNGSGWVATFTDATCCPGVGLDDQTVTITIERRTDGCCQWRLAVSLGTITTSEVVKTVCPTAKNTSGGPVSWTVDVPDTTHVITLTCAGCDNCGLQRNCCPNPIPETLTATLLNDSGCECLDGISTTLVHDVMEDRWEGTITVPRCTGDFKIDLTLECNAIIPSGNCRCFSLDTSEATCDSGRINVSPDSGCSCDPVSMTFGVYNSDCGGECEGSEPGCADVACTYKITITE